MSYSADFKSIKLRNCHTDTPEWFTFEADDDQLQDDLLQIKLFDKDTLSANDPIGKVGTFLQFNLMSVNILKLVSTTTMCVIS